MLLGLTYAEQSVMQIEGGRVRTNETTPRLLAFRPAGVGVRTAMSMSAPEFDCAIIVQAPEIYRDLAAEISWPASIGNFEPMLAFDDFQTALIAQAIVTEIDGGPLGHLLVDALSIALAVQITRHFVGPAMRLPAAGGLSREKLKRALDYIEAHLADPLSLSELAGIACLSPFHFTRCFKRSMGLGLQQYVSERRIERARRLILHSDMALTDIAAAVGFESQASFTSRFGREVGMSPGRLRRQRA